jgi:hypothetical protein
MASSLEQDSTRSLQKLLRMLLNAFAGHRSGLMSLMQKLVSVVLYGEEVWLQRLLSQKVLSSCWH